MQYRSHKDLHIEFRLSSDASSYTTYTFPTSTTYTTYTTYTTRASATIHTSGHASKDTWNVCARG
jgi:hypothetical protein